MGEMSAYYASCDAALIGGSLLPYGAQNLIEACAVGAPVVIGPSTFNFSEATTLALQAGAAVQVHGAAEAVEAVRRLLGDAEVRRRMNAAGMELCESHRGATERTMAIVERLFHESAATQRLRPGDGSAI